MILPTFQAQNPELNNYSLGWSSCTAYSAAMAGSFDKQVKLAITGERVRRLTGDTSGGLTLAQVDAALNKGIGVNLSVYYRLPWATFAKLVDSGMGGILQGGYAPIADSRFDAGRGFRGNHAIFVPPNWAAMDPLADGRYGQAYKYRNEPYPKDLLKRFAGRLVVDGRGSLLGYGYVYAAMTRDKVNSDKVNSYRIRINGGGRFWVYNVKNGVITGRVAKMFSADWMSLCTPPRSYPWPGHSSKTLVRVTSPNSSLTGRYVGLPQYHVKLEVLP